MVQEQTATTAQATAAPLTEERLESLKSGIVSGVCACILWGALWQLTAAQWPLQNHPLWQHDRAVFLLSVGIAGFSGFLFGITYRYIIRYDRNPHLQSGAVGAFALVRGLAQVEAVVTQQQWWLVILLLGQNFLLFTLVRFVLGWAIARGWISRFPITAPSVAANSIVQKKADASTEASADC